jgi:uncharacterized membrane protein HdeD (DUF308 family)
MESVYTEAVYTTNWSSLVFRGIASIIFGAIALAWPGITLVALTLIFGAFSFADGVTALVVAYQRGKRPHRWLLVLDGVFGIGIGVVTVLWPAITMLALVFLLGIRFLVMGALQLAAASRIQDEVKSQVFYAIGGVASLLLGILAFIVPGITAFVLTTMLGVFAFIFGIVTLVFALRSRRATHRIPLQVAPA